MRFVAMNGPVTRLGGVELDATHGTHRTIGGDLGPARCGWDPATIGTGDRKTVTMHMNRMISHAEIAKADTHPITQTYWQRVDAGESTTVPGPEIELGHGGGARGHAAGFDVIGIDQKDKITIHLAIVCSACRLARMDDEQAHHAHGHLRHLIGMRVIHEGAGAIQHELVDKGLADRNLRLGEATDAIHAVRQHQPMPVNGGVLGQAIGHEDAHPVTFHRLDGRAGALPVVAPQPGLHAGCDLARHRLGHQMELLPATTHAPGQGPAIERHYRVVAEFLGSPGETIRGRGGSLRMICMIGMRMTRSFVASMPMTGMPMTGMVDRRWNHRWNHFGHCRQCRASNTCAEGQRRGSTDQRAGAAGLLQELPSCRDRIGRAVVVV